jgi:hypothetical protein
MKTLEIATRCGQDSDCNPSNALAVLGVIKGFSGLPEYMQEGVRNVADSVFIHTSYSFNSAVDNTYKYALDLIARNGGKVGENEIKIKRQEPVAPALEVSFPDVVFSRKISVFEPGWSFKGNWKPFEVERNNQKTKQSMYAFAKGDELVLEFQGTGISIEGNWYRDGGKADVYVDGKLHRTIDTYYDFANQQHTTSIWHVMGLKPGTHTVRLVVTGEKRPESKDTRVYITSAIIFDTAPKKNEMYKFSFEK